MNRSCAQWAFIFCMAGASACLGQTVEDPLHGFCYGTSSCSDNGTNTPTSTNPPQFGFEVSPGPQTGDFLVDVLVPDNRQSGITSFTISGTGGTLNLTRPTVSATTTAISGEWSSGSLDSFLGINASPNNPIGAYLPCTQNPTSCGDTGAGDPTATGFSVYQANLGTLALASTSGPITAGPELNISGSSLPAYSFIVGFLNTGTTSSPSWIATADSGAIFEEGTPVTPPVPEPSSWLLLGTMVAGVGVGLWRKRTA